MGSRPLQRKLVKSTSGKAGGGRLQGDQSVKTWKKCARILWWVLSCFFLGLALFPLIEKRSLLFQNSGEKPPEAGGSSSQRKRGSRRVSDILDRDVAELLGCSWGQSHKWVFMWWKERNKPWVRILMDKDAFQVLYEVRETTGVYSRNFDRSQLWKQRLLLGSSKTARLMDQVPWRLIFPFLSHSVPPSPPW